MLHDVTVHNIIISQQLIKIKLIISRILIVSIYNLLFKIVKIGTIVQVPI